MEIAAVIFAGVTALTGSASAYNQYRANHPRRIKTGPVPNYTVAHAGYSMSAPYRPVPQYNHLIRAPTYNVNYNQVNHFVRSQTYNYTGPSQQQMVPRRATQPNRTASQPNQRPIQPAGFGGTIGLVREQQAPDTYEDEDFGLSTGARPGYTKANAQMHWQSFQRGRTGYGGEARTVAVLNWTTGVITMFVERDMTYFRNYTVSACDIASFAQAYRGNEVFSGVVKGGELVASNHPPTIVEDDGECELDSSNCWKELGISGPGIKEPVFMELVRGAVFGLICCVHKKPSCMNVDMLYGDGVDFVHVDGDLDYLENGRDCCFSVFSFLTEGWSQELVLVG